MFMSLSRSHEHLIEAKEKKTKKKNQQEKVEVDTERKEGDEEGKKLCCFFLRFVWPCVSVCV